MKLEGLQKPDDWHGALLVGCFGPDAPKMRKQRHKGGDPEIRIFDKQWVLQAEGTFTMLRAYVFVYDS